MKLTLKEFRNKKIKTYRIVFRMFIFLRISKLEIMDKNIWKNNSDYECRVQEINPYNPLSYIFLLIYLPIGLIISGFNRESLGSIKQLFKKK